MAAQSALAPETFQGVSAPTLAVVDGIPTTTSVEVARQFSRAHDEVLRRIRNLLEQLPDDHLRNFTEMVYETDIGSGATRKFPAYRLTRDGFTLLAMGFTGKKALAFKLAYIDAFNRMESTLTQRPSKPAMAGIPLIQRKPLTLPRPSTIPPEVQPLLDAAIWRIVGQAHTDITDWAERKLAYGCNLQYPNDLVKRATLSCNDLRYDDWLTQGESAHARSLMVFFEVAADLAGKATARLNKLGGAA